MPPSARRLGRKGYTVLTYSSAGWVWLFSRRPVVKPSDIENLKVAVPVDDRKMSRMLQAAGAVPVQVDIQNLVGQVATGAVDALLFSPSLIQAQWSFFKSYLPYVSDLKVSPFVGAMLINTRAGNACRRTSGSLSWKRRTAWPWTLPGNRIDWTAWPSRP